MDPSNNENDPKRIKLGKIITSLYIYLLIMRNVFSDTTTTSLNDDFQEPEGTPIVLHDYCALTPPNNDIIQDIILQPISTRCSTPNLLSLTTGTTEEDITNELFSKIQRLINDYMTQPHHHYLHCRVLRWITQGTPSRFFSAVIVINPPTPNIY